MSIRQQTRIINQTEALLALLAFSLIFCGAI